MKLTGIMSTMAVAPGRPSPTTPSMVAPQLAAPYHQHLFNVRLDLDVDGPDNTVYEVDAVADPPGPDNPLGNAFAAHGHPAGAPSSRPSAWSTRPAAAPGRS